MYSRAEGFSETLRVFMGDKVVGPSWCACPEGQAVGPAFCFYR